MSETTETVPPIEPHPTGGGVRTCTELLRLIAVGCVFGGCAAMSIVVARSDLPFGRTTVAAILIYAAVLYLPLLSALASVAVLLVGTLGVVDHEVAVNLYRLAVASGTFLAFRRKWSELSLLFVSVLS